jgi:hypothetical protein
MGVTGQGGKNGDIGPDVMQGGGSVQWVVICHVADGSSDRTLHHISQLPYP